MTTFHNKIPVNIAVNIAQNLPVHDLSQLLRVSTTFYDAIINYLDEMWQNLSTTTEVVKRIKQGDHVIYTQLFKFPQRLNIKHIVTHNFKFIINHVELLKMIFKTGFTILREMQSQIVIIDHLKNANAEFIDVLVQNGLTLSLAIDKIGILGFNNIETIYYLLDNGYTLSFNRINRLTITEIQIMINRARSVKPDTLCTLASNRLLPALYSKEFIHDIVEKGAMTQLDNWDLMSELMGFVNIDEINSYNFIHDRTTSLTNYVCGKYNNSLNIECVRYYINKGVAINRIIYNSTILNYVCKSGNKDIVDLLLEHGAVLNFNFAGIKSPVIVALENNHYSLAEYLIDRGVNPTYLLLSIAQNNNAQHIKFLIDNGANPNYILHRMNNNQDHVIENLLYLNRSKYSERTKQLLKQ